MVKEIADKEIKDIGFISRNIEAQLKL